MKFNDNLQIIRREKKLSQEDVAEKLGISRQAVAKWESGITFPDIENLIQISELFCVTIDNLVKDDSECANKCIINKDINKEKIVQFLKAATKQTYAGKGKEEEVPCRPNSHDLKYVQGNLKYFDTYFGGERFSGEETVFENDIAVWVMNYSGRTIEEQFSSVFLKEALLLRPEEAPFRGPQMHRNGNNIYYNSYCGDFTWFQGKEEIFWGDLKVFECYYHGGVVK
jgi:transcriptional regulator with XRE-family HTH domain